MRISTNTLFEVGTNRLGDLQTALAKTQEQISTGRRVLTPSDDPVAAAQAHELSQAKAMNTQMAVTGRARATICRCRNRLCMTPHP
jgi:flagellar hook-associated protein 3 FlgL